MLSIALVLVPFLFAFAILFPLGHSMLNFEVLLMYALFASAFFVAVAKFNKVRKNMLYALGLVVAVLVPVAFAVTQVFPLMASTTFSLMYLLMHFVLAGGLILAYSHRTALKNLF